MQAKDFLANYKKLIFLKSDVHFLLAVLTTVAATENHSATGIKTTGGEETTR